MDDGLHRLAGRKDDPGRSLGGRAVYDALEIVLKGPDVRLPRKGFKDKDGHVRHEIRTRWWLKDAKTFRALAFMDDVSGMPEGPRRQACALSA